MYTNFYTPVQLYSNQKHKHTTHLWSVWFKRKKNSKTPDQKWKKEKQRHILLRNVRSFPPIFEFKNIHYLFASLAEKGKLFERITDRYSKLRKKRDFEIIFFWWKEKSEVFLYDFVRERRESKECREKEQQLQLQAGRQDVLQGEEVHSWYCVRQTKTELMTVIFILLLFCVFLF